ncbi:hypothetical protein [Acrocarpospora pleiomorpha]|nr:hypothetical protein [Acrocarpospora pleiomorpha]
MDDDLIGEVELSYQFFGSPRDVVAFYKEQAAAEGWRLTRDGLLKFVPRPGKSESWPTTTCFAKDLGGFVADLQVSFDYWTPDVRENPSLQRYWRTHLVLDVWWKLREQCGSRMAIGCMPGNAGVRQ